MNIKNIFVKHNDVEKETNNMKDNLLNCVELNDKVNDFVIWYSENMLEKLSDIGKFRQTKEIRDFIEKMAVWYELRYPDYEVNRILHCIGQEGNKINDKMFIKNKYIKKTEEELEYLLDNNNIYEIFNYLEWDKFYNTKSFINSLTYKEKYFLRKPKYPKMVYIDSNRKNIHLHLTSNGTVNDTLNIGIFSGYQFLQEDFVGKNIEEVYEILKENNLLSKNNELELAIKNYKNSCKFKKDLLECVMYRIIERGGNRIGPRRGLLFAEEFNTNKDIPIKYGIDYSDPDILDFINKYLSLGGRENLGCYNGYHSRKEKNEKLEIVSLEEVIKICNNKKRFIEELINKPKEIQKLKDMRQRLVYVLSKVIDDKELVKEQRILRKLNQIKK